MLDTLRDRIPANSRGRVYTTAAALVTALVSWGILDNALAPAIVGVVGASITLAYALLHSTSPWRSAVYSLAVAVGPLAVAIGWGTNETWVAAAALVAAALGLNMASHHAPNGDAAPAADAYGTDAYGTGTGPEGYGPGDATTA